MQDTPNHFEPKKFDPGRFVAGRGAGHAGALNIQYRAHGPDWAELRLPYHPQLIGDVERGLLASGPIIALLDMVTAVALWNKRGTYQPQATLDLRVDYLRPALTGRDVIGWGECYRLTRTIGFVRGIAHDGNRDDPVAHATGTFMFTDVQP